ncbi:tRNA (adenosine(37)-N6)-threonylcarbamoyltransferase complex dimerization subunit type 1 TsaB [Denitromonas iodatirespirans]|uniref:tRNA (Adenosine(37)-N6)-threonylcarbamoyltransferase complex dimerization subunit type 1 TsaB n=1 Tax=Denitromonas iodatirespirans TaxID=2795389 RepID=A0A944H708_DENI1|nr:tRNA (adenosine(37)-N6)-threonylcarbamoyltransferase complex dimerization subunit type 1 TsaB [Denitromonas iodatirespirans]MBT0960713.1 tRNA (adenosine(37)-N6)-threonylcarbamoyltransferase complex dimerization subunit type 1 TsaB [Denitromonas iodatirespirans]
MKLLGIESSCERVSVAVLVDDQIRQQWVEGGATPSDRLIPVVLDLLAEHGLAMHALDAIALGIGPGAFTGLRLGCSVAQGFALAADLGIVPVGSLDVIAAAHSAPQVLVATDARMGETYVAGYVHGEHGYTAVFGPVCQPPEAVRLPGAGEWLGVGSAFDNYPDRLLAEELRLVRGPAQVVPEAGQLVRLAARSLRHAPALSPEQVALHYVRDKVAQTVAERLAQGGKA